MNVFIFCYQIYILHSNKSWFYFITKDIINMLQQQYRTRLITPRGLVMMEWSTLSTLFPSPFRYPPPFSPAWVWSVDHYYSFRRAILLSTDYYHQYSHVIKRQIVMGDKVRLMLEFNLETFLKCGPAKTNMVWKDLLLVWADKKELWTRP